MAQRVIITDDLDNSDGAETVSFAYQGKQYQVDLAEKSRTKLEKALEPFIAAARTSGSPAPMRQRAPRGTAAPKTSGLDYTAMDNIGMLHRGRITEEEAALVRDNKDKASENRVKQGHPPIDWSDAKEQARYGL